MYFVLLSVIGVAVLIVQLAIRPLRTLLLIVRVLFFLVALAAWILFFVSKDQPCANQWQGVWVPIVLTLPWLLTFVRLRRRTGRIPLE